MRRVTTNDIFRVIVMVLVLGLATRCAIGFTMNDRYNDAVILLKEYGVYNLSKDTDAVTYTTIHETERCVIRSLNEVSKRHPIILYTI